MIIFFVIHLTGQIFTFFYKNTIFQNQYYKINRYITFTFQKKILFVDLTISVISLFLLYFSNLGVFVFLLPLFKKHKKTKLKFTNRIIRHFILFLFVIIIYSFILSIYHHYLLVLLYFLPFWLTFFINSIIEWLILNKNIKTAKSKLKTYHPIIIGITGSYGKTSCKNYLYLLIQKKYKVLVSPSSFNTLNGLLKTINNDLKPYHEVFIAEIGVDCKKGMDKFFRVFCFNIGAITCIGEQHLKTFKTIKNIQAEKSKLLFKSKDFSIINKDDPLINKTLTQSSQISFSTISADADVFITRQDSSIIKIQIFDSVYVSKSSLLGVHNLSNLACAICIAKALNVSNDEIIKIIPTINNVEHRLSIFKYNKWIIIDDAYNSNFKGFENALSLLATYKSETKVIITPGVIESNHYSKNNQISIASKINEICDIILLINNPSFKKHINNYLSFTDFSSAYNYLKEKYYDTKLVVLIENDLPEIFIR